jgi:hypothetical protein
MKNGIATCPFCNVINRFGENERRCSHYKGFEYEKRDDSVYEDRPLAVFSEDERKVLIEEENNERD